MSFYLDEPKLRGTFRPRTLYLAEGESEVGFLEALLAKLKKSPKNNAIVCFKGLSKISSTLSFLVQEDNFEKVKAIGIMIDAETDYKARQESIMNFLHNFNIASLNKNDVEQVVSTRGRDIAIFISPGNKANGRIENLIENEISSTPLKKCVDGLDACAKPIIGNPLDGKTRVQVYLSIKKPGLCGTRYGFKAGGFDVNAPAYAAPRELFRKIAT